MSTRTVYTMAVFWNGRRLSTHSGSADEICKSLERMGFWRIASIPKCPLCGSFKNSAGFNAHVLKRRLHL